MTAQTTPARDGQRGRRKTAKSRQTFERLLQAAEALFREKGFEATTMRDLSRAGGLGLGAMYYYFSSKEELVLLFCEKLNRRVVEEFQASKDMAKPLPEALAAFLELKLRVMSPHRALLRVVLKEAMDPDSPLHPLNPASKETLAISLGLFQELVDRGGFPEDGPKGQLARGLWAAHMLVIVYWLQDRSPDQQETRKVIKTLRDALGWMSASRWIPGVGILRRKVLSHVSSLVPDRFPEGTASR